MARDLDQILARSSSLLRSFRTTAPRTRRAPAAPAKRPAPKALAQPKAAEARSGAKTIIHVNQHVIKRNQKTGERKPVLTIKQGKSNTYAHSVQILGPSEVVYRPDRPLSCGARVWIETYSPWRSQ